MAGLAVCLGRNPAERTSRLIDIQLDGRLPSGFDMSYYSHIEEARKGTKMSTETLAPGWRAIPLGPWERYRRDLDGDRRVIVARGTYGGWVWDLWGTLEAPVCLDL